MTNTIEIGIYTSVDTHTQAIVVLLAGSEVYLKKVGLQEATEMAPKIDNTIQYLATGVFCHACHELTLVGGAVKLNIRDGYLPEGIERFLKELSNAVEAVHTITPFERGCHVVNEQWREQCRNELVGLDEVEDAFAEDWMFE